MQVKRLLTGLMVGVSLTSVGIACTQQRDFQADAQTNPSATQQQAPERAPDVPYVPTPQAVVDRMLQIANVSSNDVVYDLGSGDGRIPITAVRQYKAQRAVGVDINPQQVREANQNAQQANVTDRVEFRQQDLFETDLRNASVVTLYLLPEVNLKLRPKLLRELRPGTRIVSHAFDMGDWQPERTENVEGRTIYYWTVPKNVPANLKQ
ncbi:MAG: class I SAM-dependent methyltransferase [Leptolyngbya sp. Prado105]|jgi:precorrin-6B methylase 2|nr:class I SAM-dependent methyltransferase [Leptolyngbya sp. Prado105]